MALRALDDVKESVRSAAGGLVRALRGLSLRIMDVHQTPAAGELCVCSTLVCVSHAGSYAAICLLSSTADCCVTQLVVRPGAAAPGGNCAVCTCRVPVERATANILTCIVLSALVVMLFQCADVSGCCKVVLPLLCGSQGLASSVAVARDIAADVVCTGVKTAGATQVCTTA